MRFNQVEFGFTLAKKSTRTPLIRQVHGNHLVELESLDQQQSFLEHPPEADAIATSVSGATIRVFTADCLPLLLFSDDGSRIAAIHSGWRGSLKDIFTPVWESFGGASLRVVVGPAIGACHFEVKSDFVDAFRAAGQPVEKYLVKHDNNERQTFRLADFVLDQQIRPRVPEHRILTMWQECTHCRSQLPSFRRDGSTEVQLSSWIRRRTH